MAVSQLTVAGYLRTSALSLLFPTPRLPLRFTDAFILLSGAQRWVKPSPGDFLVALLSGSARPARISPKQTDRFEQVQT